MLYIYYGDICTLYILLIIQLKNYILVSKYWSWFSSANNMVRYSSTGSMFVWQTLGCGFDSPVQLEVFKANKGSNTLSK